MWIDDYFLNSDGKIYFLNITDDPFDRLYASGENGKVNWDNYIDLEKGILDNEHFGTDAEGHDYAYYAFKNDESSDLFFYFAADHTEKEWGQVKYGTRSSYVAVTYDDGHDYGGADLLYHLLLENYAVRQHMHSHPAQSKEGWFLPSGYAENDKVKDGDRSFAAWFYRYYPAKAVSMRWLLYDATVSRTLSYDLKGAWGYNKRTKEKKYFKY